MADRPNVMIIPGITLEQARKAVMQDRGKVIKAWEAVLSRDPLDAPWDLVDETLALLKSQQAEIAELKAKEGHWEVFTMCANEGTYCSECHTKIFDFVTPPKRKLSMFCPHCGAKMSEERISR